MKGAAGQLPRLRGDIRVYLFHGSDDAGAADLARRLIASFPDSERVDLDGATLRREPGRLADEAAAMSLFGGARLIRAMPIGEESLEALTLLLDAERTGSPVVAVAPGIRSTGKLAALANAHPAALGTVCYPPTAAEIDKAVQTMLADAGLRAVPGLVRRLADAGGGDRAVIAREVEKLALYLDAAADRPRDANMQALDAIGADSGDVAVGQAADALVEGRPGDLGLALSHLDAGGASPIPWLRGLQRRLTTLADMRASLDRGEAVETVMKKHRVFFREEARTARDLRRWSSSRIVAALRRVRAAEVAAMSTRAPGVVVAENMAVTIARGMADR